MAADDPRFQEGELASALSNLAGILDKLGRSEEAIAAAEEAVTYYRQLGEGSEAQYQPDFATALNNLSIALDRDGRFEEAIAAAEEAVQHYRQLAMQDPAVYLGELASSISNLSALLDRLGYSEEALVAAEEAVAHYRQLTSHNPERHYPELANVLNNLSNRLGSVGRVEEGLTAAEEAVRLQRASAERNPSRYLPDLAVALQNLSQRFAAAERWEEATEALEETVALLRQASDVGSAPEGPALAEALTQLCLALDQMGRIAEAVEAAKEAATHYRRLSAEQARFQPDLAGALNNLSIILHRMGEVEEARGVIEEAVEIYRELTGVERTRYAPDLARALSNLSSLLAEAGYREEAAGAMAEATERRREIVRGGSREAIPDLASSLNNLAIMLAELNRPLEALSSIEEATGYYGQLAESDRDGYAPDLALALGNLSIMLAAAGQEERAMAVTDSALAEYGNSPFAGVLQLTRASLLLHHGELEGSIEAAWEALGKLDDRRQAVKARMFLRGLREQDAAGFDSTWRRAIGSEQPLWLRHLRPPPELYQLFADWLQTPTWEESREFARRHAGDLLTDEAEAAIEHLIDEQPDHPELVRHLQLLQSARREGVDAPYREIIASVSDRRRRERLEEWLTLGFEESLAYLRRNSDDLLDPKTAQDLLEEALAEPDRPDLLARAAVLNLSRSDGPEKAYALAHEIAEKPSGPPSWELSADERSLNLARLAAGMYERDPDAQFQLALLAEGNGHQREADQAIARCRMLLPSWEVREYLNRLDELISDGPAEWAGAGRLKRELAGASSELSP